MNLGLEGKIVFVAGASKGIGRATVRTLLEEGARVAMVARSADTLEQASAELSSATAANEAVAIAADLSTPEGLASAVRTCKERLGEPDVLVNCVGSAPPGAIEDLKDEQWQAAIDGKLMPAIRLIRELLPGMRARRSGAMVTVTGLAGLEPNPKALTLGVMNAGLLNLTRALARDAAAHGVRINAVLPGPTRTDRFDYIQKARAEREGVSFEEAVAAVTATIPTGRATEPEEVASVIAFLASDRASHVNGAAIAIDGGQLQGVH